MGKIFVFSRITHSIYKCHSLWCFARALCLIKNPAEWILSSLNILALTPYTSPSLHNVWFVNNYILFYHSSVDLIISHCIVLKNISFLYYSVSQNGLTHSIGSIVLHILNADCKVLTKNLVITNVHILSKTFPIERKSLKCKFLRDQHNTCWFHISLSTSLEFPTF